MAQKKQALNAVRFSGASAATITAVKIIQLVILALLLAPSDFGLMGMVQIVVGFIVIVSELGMSSAVIQRRDVSDDSLSTLYWLTVMTGIAAFLLIFGLNRLIVLLFSEPKLTNILVVASLSFIIIPIGQMHKALLEKELRFDLLVRIEVAASVAGLTSAVALALSGAGVWALIGGFLISSATEAALLLAKGLPVWRPAFIFRLSSLAGYLRFGLHLTGQRMVNYVTANIDFLIIGAALGAQPLGYYVMAYNVANLPSSRLNPVMARVLFPVFSRIQDDIPRIRTGYLRMVEYSALINAPILLGLAAIAPLAVPLFLSARWMPTVLLLQILCIACLARSLNGTVGPLLLARGRTDLGFRWSLFIVCIQVPGIYVGLVVGDAIGVAVALAILQGVGLILTYLILVRTLIGPCLAPYFSRMGPALGMGGVMGALVYGLALAFAGAPSVLLVGLQVCFGVVIYGALVCVFRKSFAKDLVEMVRVKANN